MQCKNRFCVFNRKNNVCVKKQAVLNECGICDQFYYPTYLKGLTEAEKEKFFNPPNSLNGKIYRVENKKYLERR